MTCYGDILMSERAMKAGRRRDCLTKPFRDRQDMLEVRAADIDMYGAQRRRAAAAKERGGAARPPSTPRETEVMAAVV